MTKGKKNNFTFCIPVYLSIYHLLWWFHTTQLSGNCQRTSSGKAQTITIYQTLETITG